MSFIGSRNLLFAEELAQQAALFADQEALWRCVIGRAYYAIFITAQTLVIDMDGPLPSRFEPHVYVRDWFLGRRDNLSSFVGRKLRDLRADRNQADYVAIMQIKYGYTVERLAREDVVVAQQVLRNLATVRQKAGL